MLCYDCLSKVDGLKPIMPQGSIYLMVSLLVDLCWCLIKTATLSGDVGRLNFGIVTGSNNQQK